MNPLPYLFVFYSHSKIDYNFKVVKFDHFKRGAGLSTFTLSVSSWGEI